MNSPCNIDKTLPRDARRSATFRHLLHAHGLASKKVLDVGCGFGEHLACFGQGSIGITSAAPEVAHGSEAGLAIRLGNAETIDEVTIGTFDAIWANNIFEHVLSPHGFLMKLKTHAERQTLLILGVPVVPKIVSLLRLRKFRGALATNHINFFTAHSLRLTVERAGWDIVALRPFIFRSALLDRLCAPLASHLYVVARNNPAFTYPKKKFDEWKDIPHYDWFLRKTGQKH